MYINIYQIYVIYLFHRLGIFQDLVLSSICSRLRNNGTFRFKRCFWTMQLFQKRHINLSPKFFFTLIIILVLNNPLIQNLTILYINIWIISIGNLYWKRFYVWVKLCFAIIIYCRKKILKEIDFSSKLDIEDFMQ